MFLKLQLVINLILWKLVFYNQLEDAVKIRDSLANNKTIFIKKIIWKIDDCIDLNEKLDHFDQEIINLKQNREKLIKSLSNE